jgi:hypothetical protein
MSVTQSTQGRKKKFSVKDNVVFIRSGSYYVGTVTEVKLVQKHLNYTVLAEDGKEYVDLRVDNGLTYSIDSKTTMKRFGKTNSLPQEEVVVESETA